MPKSDYGNLDPNALERAAKAVRELNASPHAKEALLSQIKWAEQKKEGYKLSQKQKEIEIKEKEVETKQKIKEIEIEQFKEKQDYIDKNERQRQKDMLEYQYKQEEERQSMIEQKLQRQEDIKKQSIDYEYEKKEKLLEKEYNWQGKKEISIKRETKDIESEHIVLKEKERRQTLKELFSMGSHVVGNGLHYLKDNKLHSVTLGLYFACASLGLYSAKYSTSFCYHYVLNKYMRPSLVRETSRSGFRNLLALYDRIMGKSKNIFDQVVFSESLQNELQILSNSIINRKTNVAPLRNVCFYGPPGTGKTLFAKQLSYFSGMDYAILSGSDGSDAVSEINKVFDWATSNPRGTILFVDEADALFRKRETNMSEPLRNAINCFLNRTGTPSYKCMLVIATNQPQHLDSALIDRIDQYLPFNLPEEEQRLKLLNLFLNKYCSPKTYFQSIYQFYVAPLSIFRNIKHVEKSLEDDFIKEISLIIKGFSCREIEKFIVYAHDAALNDLKNLDNELMKKCLRNFLQQHQIKKSWI